MATNQSAQQSDMEDVVMEDASIASPDVSRRGTVDTTFDPMDISPLPSAIHNQPVAQTTTFATEQNSLARPAFSTLQPTHTKAPSYIRNDNSRSLGPQTRSFFIRPDTRFSPKSRQHLPYSGLLQSQLQPLRKPNPFTTLKYFGPGPYNKHSNIFARAHLRPNFTNAASTTRDSSFSSLDTQKSTDDGKGRSFDSSTSISTTQSSITRKRSIDEKSDSASHYATPEAESSPFSKYRRVDETGAALPAGPSENSHDTNPRRTDFNGKATARSPLSQLPPLTNISSTPDKPCPPIQTSAVTPNTRVPGGWPSTPFHAINKNEHQSPCADLDTNYQPSQFLMSGAIPPPSPVGPNVPTTDEHNPREAPSSSNNFNQESISLTSTDQLPINTWHAYWMSWYNSVQRVYTFHRGVTQTVANAFRCAVAMAGSFTQRAYSLLEHRPSLARRSFSTTARNPSPRANIRALPEEQQRRVKEHQWRKDRGYPTLEHYPFPKLSFDTPNATQDFQAESKIQSKDDMPLALSLAMPGSRIYPHPNQQQAPRSRRHEELSAPSTMRRRQKELRGGVRKFSRVEPVNSQLKRRARLRPRNRDPERGRRELALIRALRSGNLAALEDAAVTVPKQDTSNTSSKAPQAIGHIDSTITKDQTTLLSKPKSKPKNRVRFNEPLVTEPKRISQPIVPELAPHLHPSSPKVDSTGAVEDVSIEQKENIPPVSKGTESVVAVATEEVAEPSVDPWIQPVEFPLGRPVSAVRLFYPIASPLPPGRTESIYADEWREIEEEEKRKQRPIRIRPKGPAVRRLQPKWEGRVHEVMSMPHTKQVATTLSGDPLTKRDLATCFTPMAWLNDEIINAYLALIIDYLRRSHGNAGRNDKPKFHAFNTFFFSNLRDKGYESVRRWASRAKIGGESLLNVDTVFVPVHNSAHWTLIVIKPSDRTIENFDSLGSLSRKHIDIVKKWLRGELGTRYVEEEWNILPSLSPQQDNGSDCGVFLLSTAKAVAIGIEPLAYGAKDTALLRKKIVAELMNGGLEGDFDPAGEDGEILL